jgi:hypothetical protein
MNALLAAPLGVAAALVSTAADASVQANEVPPPEPLVPPAAELAADLLSSQPPAPDVLGAELPAASAPAKAAAPAQICDEKCKFVELTKSVLPNTGVADLVSVALEPDKHALTIPSDDGTPAATIKIDPTKIARGKGLVATVKF